MSETTKSVAIVAMFIFSVIGASGISPELVKETISIHPYCDVYDVDIVYKPDDLPPRVYGYVNTTHDVEFPVVLHMGNPFAYIETEVNESAEMLVCGDTVREILWYDERAGVTLTYPINASFSDLT